MSHWELLCGASNKIFFLGTLASSNLGLAGYFTSTYLSLRIGGSQVFDLYAERKTADREVSSRCRSISRTWTTCLSRGDHDIAVGVTDIYIGCYQALID